MTCAEIGLLLGVLATHICEESLFMTFDTKLYHPKVSTRGGILAQVRSIPVKGGGTHMKLPFEYLSREQIPVDRIILFSDNQVNIGSCKPIQGYVDEYRRAIKFPCWVHGVDLQGYGTQQFIGDRINIITGWSEKVLDFILLAEQGIDTLTKRIETYEWKS